jgi:hypothetical protein
VTARQGSRPCRRILLVTVAVAVLAGCGVPTQDQATPVTLGSTEQPSPSPQLSTNPRGPALWFVRDDRLVPVPSSPDSLTAGGLVAQLAAGPPLGSPAAMRSLVGDPAHGGALLQVAPDQADSDPSGQVTVAVTDAFGALPADEQVLLLGQVVMTLGSAGASSVLVTDPAGVPLAVPLPDGRLLDGPATAADYAALAR